MYSFITVDTVMMSQYHDVTVIETLTKTVGLSETDPEKDLYI